MKKIIYTFTVILTMVIAGISLTSCDAAIASDLEGTWKGDMYTVMSYEGQDYNATYTEIAFIGNPLKATSGSGYWVDHYSNAPWDYIANNIHWSVNKGVITITLLQDDVVLYIHDYTLYDGHFTGYIEFDGGLRKFSLVQTSSPNWGDYEYNYEYHNAKSDSQVANAKGATALEKPCRSLRKE